MDRYERMQIRSAAEWRAKLQSGEVKATIDPLSGEIIVRAEVHHIAREKYGEGSIPLSLNSHREMTRRQMEEHPPDGPDPDNPVERMGRFLLGAADLLESVVDEMRLAAETINRPGRKRNWRPLRKASMLSIGDVNQKPEVTDWLVLALRAYIEPSGKSAKSWTPTERLSPSEWVLIFDCETRTTPDQHLRFGAYQLRFRGRLWERGVFYDDAGLHQGDFEILSDLMTRERPGPDGERIFLRTREAFVSEVVLKRALAVGAQIVGFNLPFDPSRPAVRHVNARGSMKGGFSFVLSEDRRVPNIAVKHLSARAALIRFTGASTGRSQKSVMRPITDRGYFVDVKTLAATLTSGTHSLASLCKLLKTPTKK